MTDIADDRPRDDPPTDGEEASSPSAYPKRGLRILKRIGLTLLAMVVLLVVLAVVLYNFGSMETPSAEVRAEYAALAAAGKVPPAPQRGLTIPIPGCRCHSTDPVLQIQHARIPIKECSRCHGARSVAGAAAAGQ